MTTSNVTLSEFVPSQKSAKPVPRPKRLVIFATHPVHYQVVVWKRLAAAAELETKVFYFSDQNLYGSLDPEFGVRVSWDVPLLEGYRNAFLRRGDLSRPQDLSLSDPIGLLRAERADYVLLTGYTHRFERQVLFAARRLGIKVLMRVEFTDLREQRPSFKAVLRELYLRWFYSQTDAFCFIGRDALEHLKARFVPESKLFFSPYCVDNDMFEAQRGRLSRAAERRALGLGEDEFTLLFTGKLIPRKDPLLLLEAIERSGVHERVALIVIGDGQLREEFLARGRALLGERLFFRGFVNQTQIAPWYVAADAFVLPSRLETWGVVVNEAMVFGLPVLLSDRVGSSRDLLVPNETGLRFAAGDASTLGAHIAWMAQHPDEVRRMGDAARVRVARYHADHAAHGIRRAIELA